MASSVPSRLETEMRSQGAVLAARADQGWEAAARAASLLTGESGRHVVVAARGSSDNAARYAQYLFGTSAGLLVGLAAPWLYAGERKPDLRDAVVMAISQSGRSPDIIAVLEAARAQRRPTLVLTNETDSPLAAIADVVVPLRAGAELSVAATKTYLASLQALAQIAACLDPRAEAAAAWHVWLDRLPELVASSVEAQLSTRDRFDRLAGISLLTVVGRGLQLPTAFETALKVRELSGIPAEPFSLPDLMHGPIAALSPAGGLWMLSTAGRGRPDGAEVAALGSATGISVAVSDDDELLAAADIAVPVPAGLPEWLAPVLAVIPAQAAALRLGEIRGVDLDHPHGLRKVTLTR